MKPKHAPERELANPFLGVLGVLLLGVAAAGMFLSKPEGVVGGFLVGGMALCIIAVLAPRLEGNQEVGLTGAKLNIAKVSQDIALGELEVRSLTLAEIEEVL